jgi:uncharacterized protein YkwD
MSDEWLQLTDDDLARATSLRRARIVEEGVLAIGPAEVAEVEGSETRPPIALRITEDDLAAIGPLPSTPPDLARLEQLMFDLINEARSGHVFGWLGSGRLQWHPGLAAVARGHSGDMLHRQYMAHESPDGMTVAQRIGGYGIGYLACGENIGVFYGTASGDDHGAAEIHAAFMDQPRGLTNHRGNILNPIWTHAGVGIALSAEGSLVATQNFISAPIARLRGR